MKFSSIAILFCLCTLLFVTTQASAQAPGIRWGKCYGGIGYDAFQAVKPTADGGTIAIGNTDSNDSLVVSRHAFGEVYVVKTDSTGKQEWYNTYGGSSDDFGYDIIQTIDGGYIFVGGTYSDDGDVTGNHGSEDVWVVKISSLGAIQWQNCFGGSSTDEGHAITASADGNYYVAGITSSNDQNVSQSFGETDIWLLKIDFSGFLIWQQSYGGSGDDEANAVAATPDSGCIIVGSSTSIDGEVTGNNYSEDFWVVKVNSAGAIGHNQCYGSLNADFGTGVALTTNGNYLVCGAVNDSSLGGPHVSGNATYSYGGQDFWVLKLNSSLGGIWQKSYGGSLNDVANGIVANADGSAFVVGTTASNDSEVSGNHGKTDTWLIDIDSSSNLLWQTCIGDTGDDFGNGVCVAIDSNIIVGGTSNSNAGLLSSNHGSYDGFLTRLSKSISGISTLDVQVEASVYPNPTSDYVTVKLISATAIKSIQLNLVDITGRTLYSEVGKSATSYYSNQIDVSTVPAGIYFLTMRVNDIGYVVKKVVKD